MTKYSTSVLPLSLLFAVHLIVFGWFSMTIERRVSPDSMNYISVARNAISGDGFVQSAPGYNQPTFWAEHFSADAPRKTRSTHNVGYSLVIAAVAIVVRLEASDAAFLLSATAYGVALVAAFFFARRLWDFEAGLLAAGTLAIALRREFLYARTDPIAIALFLVMLALLAQRVTYRRAATAGVLAGCVLLVRGAGMAPVALLGAVACLLATEHRVRLLLLYAVGVLLPLPGGSVGNGQVYPTQLSSVSTYTSQTSLAQLVANFGEATVRAVSTSLRQPDSAFTVATPRHRRGATTIRSSGGRGRATTACCESSGVPVVGPGASWRVVLDGGLIHTAVGKVSGRGGPLTNRSGCAA